MVTMVTILLFSLFFKYFQQRNKSPWVLTSTEAEYERHEFEDLHVILDEYDHDGEDEGGDDEQDTDHLERLGRLPPT